MRIAHKGVFLREIGRREGRPRWLYLTGVVVLWLLELSSFAQTLSLPEPLSYQLLRFDEDYRYLQELLFGSQRLVAVREGPNVRQSFDGGRLILTSGATRVDVLLTVPVETNPGIFNDASDHTRLFWGIYAVGPLPLLPQGHSDLYYLGLDRKQARFDQGGGHELRHSVGTRLWG